MAEFSAAVDDDILGAAADAAQREVHLWGRANSVSFDPSKEKKLRLCRRTAAVNFKLLGVLFDTALRMEAETVRIAARAQARVTAILRTWRQHGIVYRSCSGLVGKPGGS